jgi:hypothetical protein
MSRLERFNFWLKAGMLGLFLAVLGSSSLMAQTLQQASGSCSNALNRLTTAYSPLPPTEGQSASFIYFYEADAATPSENVVYATVSCSASNVFIYYTLTRVFNQPTPQIAFDIFRAHANACIASKGTPILVEGETGEGQDIYRLRCNFKYQGEPIENE